MKGETRKERKTNRKFVLVFFDVGIPINIDLREGSLPIQFSILIIVSQSHVRSDFSEIRFYGR
jgi:hypothetical protein